MSIKISKDYAVDFVINNGIELNQLFVIDSGRHLFESRRVSLQVVSQTTIPMKMNSLEIKHLRT